MFAYFDKYGILHVVDDKKTAEEYSINGKIIETNIEDNAGLPVVNEEQVFVYDYGANIYVGGNKNDGRKVSAMPELNGLIEALK